MKFIYCSVRSMATSTVLHLYVISIHVDVIVDPLYFDVSHFYFVSNNNNIQELNALIKRSSLCPKE